MNVSTKIKKKQKIVKSEPPRGAPIYKPKSPHWAFLTGKHKINNNSTITDTYHLLLDVSASGLQYVEGQSIGVLAPGKDVLGKPHKLRLYSIASSRHGEQKNQATIALTVKRYFVLQQEKVIIHRGVGSNYLIDLSVGDKIAITGPVGKEFALPTDPTTDLIFFATGTGIAPFRGFLQYIFRDLGGWQGEIYLFFGAKFADELLYCNQINQDLRGYLSQIHFFSACSREQKNSQNQRLYVSDILQQQSETVFELFSRKNTAVYICGIRDMRKSIEKTVDDIFRWKNSCWGSRLTTLKQEGRWNVDVY